MSILETIFGDATKKELVKLQPALQAVNALEAEVEKLSGDELTAQAAALRQEVLGGKTLEEALPLAFALVREAAKRTLGQRHYDVQVLGGIVLHQGKIAEMKTGEGKTLVSTLPVFLNALEGKGAHVVTVNDYLAKRDAVWMGQIYAFLGLSVGCVIHEGSYLYDASYTAEDTERDETGSFKVFDNFLRPCSKKEAYAADVTYGTNNEFGFDYLRDNMAFETEQMSQRGHRFAIVDEVDSVLIDEARTPLIISAPDQESSSWYGDFARLMPQLVRGEDYEVDEKLKAVTLTEQGINRVEKLLGVGDIYQEKGIKYIHHLENALKAQALFERDRDYVVRNGEVLIVDEFTGRMLPGRRYSEGLHQALEAKEGVRVQPESLTLASVTFQNFFRMYDKVAGMTGTALTSAEEFHKVYGLEVLPVPTHRPLIRQDFPDRVYKTKEAKFRAVAKEVKERHEKGQPVLVGTVSIEKNEYLHRLLETQGVPHEVLNAKNHEKEAEIIAQAGAKGAVTVATNMAGRGVDIILGGNPSDEKDTEEVRALGGLHVIGTERHEARRIDNQLRGRSGRQGDPGSSAFYVSLEDDLMRVFGGERIQGIMTRLKIPEDEAIEAKLVSSAIESAQGKIEGMHFDTRKHVLDYDDVLNRHREIFYAKRREVLEMAKDESIKEYAYDLVQEQNLSHEALAKREEELGSQDFVQFAKAVMLRVMDSLWIDHLETMEALRDSVRLRAYGQQDPLVEYKNEGRREFDRLLSSIDSLTSRALLEAQVHRNHPQPVTLRANLKKESVGRNDPCPCGSGLKYKRCGLVASPSHRT